MPCGPLAVQPTKVETLLGERSLTDGGMIPRLLVCHTQARALPIVDAIEGIPASVAGAWAEAGGCPAGDIPLRHRLPVTIEPTPDAREAMKEHFNSIAAIVRQTDLHDVNAFRWPVE